MLPFLFTFLNFKLKYNIALLLIGCKCPLVCTLTGPFHSAGAANKVDTLAFKTKIEQILSLHSSLLDYFSRLIVISGITCMK